MKVHVVSYRMPIVQAIAIEVDSACPCVHVLHSEVAVRIAEEIVEYFHVELVGTRADADAGRVADGVAVHLQAMGDLENVNASESVMDVVLVDRIAGARRLHEDAGVVVEGIRRTVSHLAFVDVVDVFFHAVLIALGLVRQTVRPVPAAGGVIAQSVHEHFIVPNVIVRGPGGQDEPFLARGDVIALDDVVRRLFAADFNPVLSPEDPEIPKGDVAASVDQESRSRRRGADVLGIRIVAVAKTQVHRINPSVGLVHGIVERVEAVPVVHGNALVVRSDDPVGRISQIGVAFVGGAGRPSQPRDVLAVHRHGVRFVGQNRLVCIRIVRRGRGRFGGGCPGRCGIAAVHHGEPFAVRPSLAFKHDWSAGGAGDTADHPFGIGARIDMDRVARTGGIGGLLDRRPGLSRGAGIDVAA